MSDVLGFIGLGSMGSGMARRLAVDEPGMYVHDINTAAASKFSNLAKGILHSPIEMGDTANIVFLCMPDLKAGEDVVLGEKGLVHGRRVKVIVDLSTTGSRFAEKLGEAASKYGITYLASPVSGGLAGAAAGTLAVMCSGPEEQYKQVLPYLERLSKRVFYLGEKPGSAQTMKLINNILSSIGLVAACQAFVFGTKAGLDPDLMLEVLNSGTGRNSATWGKFPLAILPRTFDHGSKTSITAKDVELCLAEADALGVDMSIAKASQKVWQSIIDQGAADEDNTVLIKYLEKPAGVIVEGKAARDRRQASR